MGADDYADSAGRTAAYRPRTRLYVDDRLAAGVSVTLGREASHYVRDVLRHFYAYCEQVDAAVGIVLDALRDAGLVDQTLTVFSADHGDNVGAHRCMVKGWTPYEETQIGRAHV